MVVSLEAVCFFFFALRLVSLEAGLFALRLVALETGLFALRLVSLEAVFLHYV